MNYDIKIIEYLSAVVESRDLSSEVHCQHVRKFTEIIFDKILMFFPEYGLTEKDREAVCFGAVLHDIGKIGIPDKILQKPGRLSFEEFQIIKNHTTKGKNIFEGYMKNFDEDDEYYKFLSIGRDICFYHHEKFDGTGYPKGLVGDEIPIAAQIVGLADVYDTLTSDRIYKSAYSKEEAFEMIVEGECGVFSPRLIEVFQMVRMEIEEALAN